MTRFHRYTTHTLRTLFGLLFIFAGLNHIFGFWEPPAPHTNAGRAFIASLGASGFIMPLLGVLFTYAGVALIAHRMTALALLLLAAPVVVIFGFHFVTEGEAFGPHIFVLAIYLWLAWEERAAWSALFAADGKKPTPTGASPFTPAF